MSLLPRGMRDFAPDDMERFERIRDEFKEACGLYGFRIMEPSPLEMLSTLEAKSGPSIRDEIYHFKDKAGRSLGLRFDLTVGLTRFACADRAAPLPIKLASFAGVFRYDEPQHARYRWFYQWDVETYGSPNMEADVEAMEFTSRLLSKCGLRDNLIRVGDRMIVQEFIERHLGRKGEDAIELMRVLDKVEKKSGEELVEEYREKGFKVDEIQAVLSFGKLEGSSEEVVSKLRELKLSTADRLEELGSLIKASGVKHEVSLRIVRGIDYYNAVVFEAFDPSRPDLGAIAGGGRFDNLPRIFGRDDLAATGVAGGVERLMLALESTIVVSARQVVYVAYAGGMVKEALKTASDIRSRGIACQVDLQRRTLSKQLEAANKLGVRHVVIVAPKEYSEGKLILKRLTDGSENLITLDELQEELG